jgi:hypothetical protein
MGKYDPLRDYLRRQKSSELELSFVEVERKLGYLLPKSADAPEWWAGPGEPSSRPLPVQQQAWRYAGYDAALIPGADRVRFRKTPPEEAA